MELRLDDKVDFKDLTLRKAIDMFKEEVPYWNYTYGKGRVQTWIKQAMIRDGREVDDGEEKIIELQFHACISLSKETELELGVSGIGEKRSKESYSIEYTCIKPFLDLPFVNRGYSYIYNMGEKSLKLKLKKIPPYIPTKRELLHAIMEDVL